MFDVREINIAIELWGVVFCAIGIACALMFARTATRYRNLSIALFSLELVSAGGDAVAGIFRGQDGALAWAMTHACNLLTYFGSFLLVGVLTTYICARIVDAGGKPYLWWRRAAYAAAACMCVLAAVGAFYYIDSANLYHRTDLYWVAAAFSAVVNCVNTVLVLANARNLGWRATACLLFCSLAPTLASVPQGLLYGPNFVMVVAVLGLVVVFLEMQAHTARQLAEQEKMAAEAQAEAARALADAAESRMAVMVSQIQPHFLFNSLDTIYGLIDEDAGKAKTATVDFSRYLRANLESLKRTTPVPIETELRHVRTYLELERLSDESRLDFEVDAQAGGFFVPALSIQTLAENAAKHGVGQRESGGRIVVRTSEEAGEFVVQVEDDGVGFDCEGLEGAEGVGIANTRARLAAMCEGALELESEPGRGTVATVRVPKRKRAEGDDAL